MYQKLGFLWLAFVFLGSPVAAQSIEYELSHPHRLFGSAQALERGIPQWKPATSSVAFLESAFAERRIRGGAVFNFQNTYWEPGTGGYAPDYLRPANGVFDAEAELWLRQPPAGICSWDINGVLARKDVPCNERIRTQVELDTAGAHTRTRPTRVLVHFSDGTLVASAAIHPRHLVVLALGDSYSSGEGNPDQPARWKAVKENFDHGSVHKQLAQPARWWDSACHRSLLSWQSLIASRLVADLRNKHAVSFLSFACSGALVFDGILQSQVEPPGQGAIWLEQVDGADTAEQAHRRRMVRYSQINAAVRTLCQGPVGSEKMVPFRSIRVYVTSCESLLKPDAVLLTIGGNDVQFAGVIKDIFLPRKGRTWIGEKLALPGARNLAGTVSGQEARRIAREVLPGRLSMTSVALQDAKLAGPRNVFMVRYPRPIQARPPSDWFDAVSACAGGGKTTRGQCRVHFNHLALTSFAGSWVVPDITGADDLAPIEPFPSEIAAASADLCARSWRCSDAVGADGRPVDHLGGLNFYAHPDGAELASHEPTFLHDRRHFRDCKDKDAEASCWFLNRQINAWDAYVDPGKSLRYVRTFNDALFAQAVRSEDGRIARESLYGVMHPTAMGHAFMADGAYPGLRDHLCATVREAAELAMCGSDGREPPLTRSRSGTSVQ